MADFIDLWTGKLVGIAGGAIDEKQARALVAEIYEAAVVRGVRLYEEEIALREAERDE
ncbi:MULTISPECIES: hypothetical protein [unclassified Streptomyces]|uniref:Uncharacterized protein n=1 Tax=Streptomyces millisiae TaxID=3075542 RepID=A0ABU2LTM3_9ACTN|nr:hypothetical protein [Streptomyces sp. DSM 44918]MDT0320951.1 hypothetical protein [Streptomyces sp. DSM 44918]